MLRNRKLLWILAFILIAAIASTLLWLRSEPEANSVETTGEAQTAVARRGDLVIFASAAGQIIASEEVSVGFSQGGILSERLVSVGDLVQAGDLMARLETSETPASITAAIANAQLAVLNAETDLEEIYSSHPLLVAEALKAIEDTEIKLEELLVPDLRIAQALQSISSAQDEVDSSSRVLFGLQSTASQADIDSAYANLLLAEQALDRAKTRYEPYENKPEDNITKANLLAQLSSAQESYNYAVLVYNALTGEAGEEEMAAANADYLVSAAALDLAKREWERIKDGPSRAEIAVAEAEVAAAKAGWEQIKDGPNKGQIAIAEAKLANAQAQLQITQSLSEFEDLFAPFSGTVLEITANVNERLSTSALISIAALDQPLLEIYLDETDLDKVAVGFETDIIFDAFPEETFKGVVVEVSPKLVQVSGVQAIQALVQLTDYAKPQQLPIGLNATVDVIGGRAEDAVLIPVEALVELDPDEYAVFVMDNNEPVLRTVDVGLIDFTSAEIINGLEPGDIITTGIVETE